MPENNNIHCMICGTHSEGYEELYILGYITPCSPLKLSDVSEDYVASIFKIEE
jgi:hypothetical protein